jgi:signal transduction histidine kinase
MKSLSFLANLGGITLDRLQADNLYTQLLISEEQNRIASEIHDGVSQYLFSLGCSLHNLSKQQLNLQDVTVQQQLKLLESLVNRASSD